MCLVGNLSVLEEVKSLGCRLINGVYCFNWAVYEVTSTPLVFYFSFFCGNRSVLDLPRSKVFPEHKLPEKFFFSIYFTENHQYQLLWIFCFSVLSYFPLSDAKWESCERRECMVHCVCCQSLTYAGICMCASSTSKVKAVYQLGPALLNTGGSCAQLQDMSQNGSGKRTETQRLLVLAEVKTIHQSFSGDGYIHT